jgi:RNA polymerase sigma-70 factor (ECF subfamily)
VWIDVFASVARLNDPAAFGAWVYRIARDKAYRQLRAHRVPCAALEDHLLETNDPEEQWSAEDAAQVRAALDELPPAHREVLLLQFVEEMTYEQIAALTACPVGTVRSRIHYAKRALRAAIERKLIKEDERP